jgi:aryl-alcohol dehydrogenase-like predicted oxidoreductase
MQTRLLGSSGLQVPLIALGAGHLGDSNRSDSEVELLLDRALELGVTLVDTAPSYGASEERLGRWAGARRGRVLLSTKCGYGVPGHEDWTASCVSAGVDAALRRLRAEVIDVVHLHSCPREVLERPGVVDALVAAQRAGKVRVAGYSGEGEALRWAIESGAFGAVQCSVSLFDQAGATSLLPLAAARGVGVLAKRPLGNAPWRFSSRPAPSDVATYWDRMRAMELPEPGEGWQARAVRFALCVSGVSALLVGTSRVGHLEAAVRAAEKGPLPDEEYAALRAAFDRASQGWGGLI